MLGRPIRLMTTTVVSALAVAISAPAALACYSGCGPAYVAPPVNFGTPCGSCGQSYVAPPVVYAPPPVVYTSPCGGCAALQPAYRVDLGPTYQLPAVADYIYCPRPYPYVRHVSRRWAYHHSHREFAAVEHVSAYGRPIVRGR